MSPPGNKKYAIFGDWYAKLESGNPNWRSELTPDEIVAMQAELDWASKAKAYDWPGPRRIGVMY